MNVEITYRLWENWVEELGTAKVELALHGGIESDKRVAHALDQVSAGMLNLRDALSAAAEEER